MIRTLFIVMRYGLRACLVFGNWSCYSRDGVMSSNERRRLKTLAMELGPRSIVFWPSLAPWFRSTLVPHLPLGPARSLTLAHPSPLALSHVLARSSVLVCSLLLTRASFFTFSAFLTCPLILSLCSPCTSLRPAERGRTAGGRAV